MVTKEQLKQAYWEAVIFAKRDDNCFQRMADILNNLEPECIPGKYIYTPPQ